MERNIYVPQNMQEWALALRALQTTPYGNFFYLDFHIKTFATYFTSTWVRIETYAR